MSLDRGKDNYSLTLSETLPKMKEDIFSEEKEEKEEKAYGDIYCTSKRDYQM